MTRILKPNGLPFEEGEVITTWMKGRFKANKNALIAIIGQTGSGKSYTSMRIAELWYKRHFDENFPIENVCFSITELAKRLRDGQLKKGSMLVFEEAGVNVNALEFQSKLSRIFTHVMQSFRSKNIGIIFNLPSIGFMNKTTRVLLHAMFQTMSIDRKTKEVLINPYIIQYNSMQDKIYNKHFRVLDKSRQMIEIQELGIGLPSEELIKKYEEKKDTFVHSVLDKLIEEGEPAKVEEKSSKIDIEFEKRVEYLWGRGYRTVKDLAKIMGVGASALTNKNVIDIIIRLNESEIRARTPAQACV